MASKGKKQPAAASAPAKVTETPVNATPAPAAPKPVIVVDNTPTGMVLRAQQFWAKYATLNDDVHNEAVAHLAHADKSGDLRGLLEFINLAPRSIRKVRIAAWAVQWGPVKMGKRNPDDTFQGINQTDKAVKPYDLAGAKANPFYVEPEAVKAKALPEFITRTMAEIKNLKKLIADPSIPRKGNFSDDEISDEIKQRELAVSAVMGKRSNVA